MHLLPPPACPPPPRLPRPAPARRKCSRRHPLPPGRSPRAAGLRHQPHGRRRRSPQRRVVLLPRRRVLRLGRRGLRRRRPRRVPAPPRPRPSVACGTCSREARHRRLHLPPPLRAGPPRAPDSAAARARPSRRRCAAPPPALGDLERGSERTHGVKEEGLRSEQRAGKSDSSSSAVDSSFSAADSSSSPPFEPMASGTGRPWWAPPPSSTVTAPSAPPYHSPPSSFTADPPAEFLCSISGSLMADPVVVPPGQTFERTCIQAYAALAFSPPAVAADLAASVSASSPL
ncbi:hypothetical protein BAE44_0005324, partial [Dichanthelium oligosanthes]